MADTGDKTSGLALPADRATAAEPVVSALRDGIPSADQRGSHVDCPKCATAFHIDIAAAVGKDQKFSYRVYPEIGSMMQAKAIGGQLVAMDDLMRACGKQDGGKVATYLERVTTHEDGSIEFFLVVLSVVAWDEKKGRFVRKPAQGMAARSDATGTGAAEGNSPTPNGGRAPTPAPKDNLP